MARVTEPKPKTTTADRLSADELRKIDAYWRACNYLAAGMIYLRGNPLLREPLKPEHIKNRLLGHWGSDPGQTFTWVHLNRLIKKYDLDMIYISGPGHGAPATLSGANEVAVEAFLAGRIPWTAISDVVVGVLEQGVGNVGEVADVLEADRVARERARSIVDEKAAAPA